MPLPQQVPPVPKQLMREVVYERIRDWVIQGSLQPGERLRDQDIATLFQISRTPVREALRRLEDEGFVETSANRWTRVTSLDTTQSRVVYPLITALEQLAVELASPPLPPPVLSAMTRSNEELRAALLARDGLAASDADHAFHQALINAAGNPDLVEVLGHLKLKLRRLEIGYFGGSVVASRSVEEHEHIIGALRASDAAAAGLIVKQHWQSSLERVEAQRRRIEQNAAVLWPVDPRSRSLPASEALMPGAQARTRSP